MRARKSNRTGRRLTAYGVTGLMVLGGVAVADTAWAATECSTVKQDHADDSSARVRAWSYQIDANKKVRGELIRSSLFPNHFTPWFTDDSGTSYYSSYGSFAIGTACEIGNV